MPTKTDLNNHYHDAIKWCDNETFAYFVTDLLNIGSPVWDTSIPTACVSVPSDTANLSDFQYRFNPDFAAGLEPSTLAFVAAHETLHIVLNHLRLGKTYADPKLFNIAADCVINDYLASQGFDVPDWVMRGEEKVGFDTANATVSEVYTALAQAEAAGDQQDEGEPGDGLVDDHSWIHNASDQQGDAAEAAGNIADGNGNVPQEVKDTKSDVPGGGGQGFGIENGSRSYFRDGKVSLRWERLLRRVNPDAFKGAAQRASWVSRPRRIAGMPEAILPDYDTNRNRSGRQNQPAIVIALDTSGSIADDDARRFVNLARSVPKGKIKLFPMTFTTEARDLDLDNPQYVGGGTEFGCIETYIQENVVPKLGHYPKAVVVITDGEATFCSAQVDERNKKSWTWLVTRPGKRFDRYAAYDDGPNFGTVEPLSDYTG